jgi:hypothetical protein
MEFVMAAIYHAFRRGRRILILIQGTWFLLTERDPRRFVKMRKACKSDFQKAAEWEYRAAPMSGSMTVNVLRPVAPDPQASCSGAPH